MKEKIKIDTPSIMFTSLTSKTWGRTFGFCAELNNGDIDPELLKKACRDIRPQFPYCFTNLRKGLFWNYQIPAKGDICVFEEKQHTVKPVCYQYNGKPDFRLTYYKNRLCFEAAHCLGDGNGLLKFFEAVIIRYSRLKANHPKPIEQTVSFEVLTENSFDTYYQPDGEKTGKKSANAYHFPEVFDVEFPEILYAQMPVDVLKAKAHEKQMTVTEYLSAVLILGVLRAERQPIHRDVAVFVPVNLRRFFPSQTMRNFVVQAEIRFAPNGKRDYTLNDICEKTGGLLKAQLNTQNLQKTINKYGALVHNPVINVIPNFVKLPVMRMLQKNSHKSATTIFTNLGQCTLPPELENVIKDLRFINGDTRYYGLPATVSCVSCNNTLTLCWSQANSDKTWMNQCLDILNGEGVSAKPVVG